MEGGRHDINRLLTSTVTSETIWRIWGRDVQALRRGEVLKQPPHR